MRLYLQNARKLLRALHRDVIQLVEYHKSGEIGIFCLSMRQDYFLLATHWVLIKNGGFTKETLQSALCLLTREVASGGSAYNHNINFRLNFGA